MRSESSVRAGGVQSSDLAISGLWSVLPSVKAQSHFENVPHSRRSAMKRCASWMMASTLRRPGAGLVHAIEAGEDVRPVLLGDADPRVGDGEDHLLLVPLQGDAHRPAGDIVFHGVFHQIEDDVEQIVLRCADAAAFQIGRAHV